MAHRYNTAMKDAGELIRRCRGKTSLAEMSRLTGIRKEYLRLTEDGVNILYPNEARALCDVLSIDPSRLLEVTGLDWGVFLREKEVLPVWYERDDWDGSEMKADVRERALSLCFIAYNDILCEKWFFVPCPGDPPGLSGSDFDEGGGLRGSAYTDTLEKFKPVVEDIINHKSDVGELSKVFSTAIIEALATYDEWPPERSIPSFVCLFLDERERTEEVCRHVLRLAE